MLVFGAPLTAALEAAEALDATVVNMRFVRPLDGETLRTMAESHELLVTVEENAVAAGAGTAVSEWLANDGLSARVRHVGLPDRFIEHGSPEALLKEVGLDAEGIRRQVQEWMEAEGS
jgi:1-deoxy-D-xylulose-5-phosphate synthase